MAHYGPEYGCHRIKKAEKISPGMKIFLRATLIRLKVRQRGWRGLAGARICPGVGSGIASMVGR